MDLLKMEPGELVSFGFVGTLKKECVLKWYLDARRPTASSDGPRSVEVTPTMKPSTMVAGKSAGRGEILATRPNSTVDSGFCNWRRNDKPATKKNSSRANTTKSTQAGVGENREKGEEKEGRRSATAQEVSSFLQRQRELYQPKPAYQFLKPGLTMDPRLAITFLGP